MQTETLCESHRWLSNVTIDDQRVGQPKEIENEIVINPDDVTLSNVVKIQWMNMIDETILNESNLAVESRTENVGIEFDEHVVSVSSEDVFMDESLETETADDPDLEFRLRLDSDTDDEEKERIHRNKERFSPAPPENAGVELVAFDEHPLTISPEAVLTRESDEKFVFEPGPEKFANKFDDHLIAVLPEAVFMDESLERETANEPALEFHLRLDNETDDEEVERILPFKESLLPENAEIELVTFDELPVSVSPEVSLTRESDEEFVLEFQPEIASIEFDEHLVTALSKADFMDESLERETAKEPALEFCLRLDSEDDEEEGSILPYKERFSPVPPENAGIELVGFDEHPVSVSSEAVLTREAGEEFVVEPRPENVANEFDEHLVTVSSEAVFMGESLERGTTNEPVLQLHLRLDSEDDEDEESILPYNERFSPANVLKINEQKPNEILVPDANAFHMKLRRRAIEVVENCSIPSSSRAELVLAKAKGEKQSTETELAETCTNKSHTDGIRILRKRRVQVSTNPLKAKLKRTKETAEQIKPRVATRAVYMRERIANETADERKAAADAERYRKKIANETAEQRKARLASRREKMANETTKQRKARLARKAKYHRQRMANETAEQRKARLVVTAEKKRKKMANETAEQRKARLAYYSEYGRRKIANETTKQRKARLAAKSERKRKQIVNETAEQRKARLASRAEYIRQRKAKETAEQRMARLAADAETHRKKRANEAEERKTHLAADAERKRKARLASKTEYMREKKAAKMPAQRKKPVAERTRQRRACQTPEQREEDRAGHVERTRQERSEEREKRLSRANTMP